MRYVDNMRGTDEQQTMAFSYINWEERIPQDHPLRAIRRILGASLETLSLHFDAMYARRGRPSIAPERLLRALLLQILFSIRSERQLMEQLNYNNLFRWFVGLNPDDGVWDVTVYTKNRKRLMQGDISARLLASVVEQARAAKLVSEEHFTVDGTLIEAWANRRSFQPKDPAQVVGTGARGKKLLRDKVESATDPDARLYSKGGPSEPCYLGHVISENRNGIVMAACATKADKKAEPKAALQMLDKIRRPAAATEVTLGADKAYQTEEFIVGLRERKIVPHVAEYAPNPKFPNFLTEEERNHPGFGISQSKRKLVEKVFGWGKQQRPVKQIKLRGVARVDWMFRLVMAAHNVVRLVRLMPTPVPVPVQ
jgi:transposase